MKLHYRDAALRVLWLSRGMEPAGATTDDWAGMFETARRERLLALAWHRSGETIRRLAPAAVAGQWRTEVLRALDRGEVQLAALATVLERFAGAGVDTVVLKGAPLAQRLYGDPGARPSLDIDLFVPAGHRAAARAELEALGWRHVGGGAPWEESFHLVSGPHQLLVEVHSWLLDDPVLLHLRLPAPEASLAQLPALECQAQGGALLPACLAAHLAKHDNAPLLWVNDFSTLWGSLDDRERGSARTAARAFRLGGYLDWAIARATFLERAAAGDPEGLDRLGYGPGGRRESHGLIRVARLAAGPSDAAAVLMGRIWPPHLRGDGRGLVRQAAERLVGRIRRASGRPSTTPTPARRPAGTSGPHSDVARTLDVGREEFRSLLRDLMGAGVGAWIRARGESMEPTIPNASLVHIAPLPARPLAGGEVVLAELPDGSFAVHRVVSEQNGVVAMQGDAISRRDPDIGRESVIGLADQLEIDGRVLPIPAAPSRIRRHVSGLVRRWRRRLPWLARAHRRAGTMARAGGR